MIDFYLMSTESTSNLFGYTILHVMEEKNTHKKVQYENKNYLVSFAFQSILFCFLTKNNNKSPLFMHRQTRKITYLHDFVLVYFTHLVHLFQLPHVSHRPIYASGGCLIFLSYL
jgi:hypothetical protein